MTLPCFFNPLSVIVQPPAHSDPTCSILFGGSISILLPALFWKVMANFCRNLTVRHLINRFKTDDASTEVVSFKTFSQFALCLTGTKDQNRFGITHSRNYRIIINVEMSRKRFLAAIVRGHLQCFIGPSRGESPERRSCFSAFDIISLASSPLSVNAPILAFLWSIHKPTFVPIAFSFVF